MKTCNNCGAENCCEAKFCERCGTPFLKKCIKCGADNNLSAAFCNQCGSKLSLNDGKMTCNGHVCIDLGLPSGTQWATCNIGANKPEDFGEAFAWGETEPKFAYGVGNYKYGGRYLCNITKYNTKQEYGPIDNKIILEPSDDVATVKWGKGWRLPTLEETDELIKFCEWHLTTLNNVQGCLIKAYNGNSIFIPTAGCLKGLNTEKDIGCYWINSIVLNCPTAAHYLSIDSKEIKRAFEFRVSGMYVRPVCK